MLLQNSPVLENVIVKLLQTAKEGLSAAEIREQVNQSWKTYSRRGIYAPRKRRRNSSFERKI